MTNYILSETGKTILLGNEAIARGALESGVGFVSTYPGTPASEIGDTFARIAKTFGIYFEYSVNEKVALEAAAGASFAGVKSLVAMKHYGLNVASDSFMPIVYLGASPMVVVVADDPNCWSSIQSEQDSRWYSRLAHIPMIEPSSPQEAKDFTKLAFRISEKFQIPVLIRTTTRVSHTRGIVKLGKLVKGKTSGKFVKNPVRFNTLPPHILDMHREVLEKMEKIRKFSERTKINFIINGKGRVGIITSGIGYEYVVDSLNELKLKLPVLKLSFTYPLPEKKIKNFIKKLKTVLVVEELDDILEEEVRKIAKDSNPKLEVHGKDLLPKAGEYKIEHVIYAISKLTKKKFSLDFAKHLKQYKKLKIPRRFPTFCPGCQHRALYYAVKSVAPDAVFGGDIGCYLLSIFPPYEMADFILSMGANASVVHGIKKVSNQKAVIFLGDSTFFHAGMPGVLNTVFNKSNPLIIILDNRYTAMTGHQPHPGTGKTGMGDKTVAVKIEDIVRSYGIKNVKVVDPFNVKAMKQAVKEFLDSNELSVIVAKRECQLMATRRKKKLGIKIPKFEIDQSKCKRCGKCLELGCPAIYVAKDGSYHIDSNLCTGCSVCSQICPYGAIKVKK